MAHNITKTDSLALAGRPAWHGLGTILPDAFSPDEALAAGYLNWEVSLVGMETMPLIGGPHDGARVIVPSRFAVVRSDTGTVLGTVGARYTPVQNSAALAAIRDGVAAVSDLGVQIESCGSFKGGALTFTCVRTHAFNAAPGDAVNCYALFSNSHDGSQAFTCLTTSVRVVCNNTLNLALRSGTQRQAVRHTATALPRIQRIAGELVAGVAAAQQFEGLARALAGAKPAPSALQALYVKAYDAALGAPDDFAGQRRRAVQIADWQRRLRNSRNALGNSADGSLWAALNSVTEWADHARTVRGEDSDGASASERRVYANLHGGAAKIKQAALEVFAGAL